MSPAAAHDQPHVWTFDEVLLGTCPWCDASMDPDATTCPSCGGRTVIEHDRRRLVTAVVAVIGVSLLAGWAAASMLGGGAPGRSHSGSATAGSRGATTTPRALDAASSKSTSTSRTLGPAVPAAIVARNAAARKSGASAATTPATTQRPNAGGVVAATAAQGSSCIAAWNADSVARASLAAFANGAGGATVRGVAIQQPGRRCRISFHLAGSATTVSSSQVLDYVRTPAGFRRTASEVTHVGFDADLRGVAQPFGIQLRSGGALRRAA